MTRNKRKMRKHELKKQAFLAGLTTMAVGAVALSSGYVQADEQVSSSNPSSDVSLVTGQEANQTISDIQSNPENQEQARDTTDNQVQAENKEQAQATGNQVGQSSTDESQTGLESHEISGTGVQAESETDPTQVTPIETEVNKEAGQENSTVKRASVVAVVERKTANTVSAARGDDYPAYLKNAAPDSVIDPWRLYNRECTSFTAWRLQSVNGFTIPGAYGNGGQWGYRARREGYRVDNNPAIGSVGWLDDGSYGHVAWISNVMGDNVEIEEYNYGYTHNYHRRVAHKSAFTGYIHFKDLAVVSKPSDGRYDVESLAPATDRTLSDGDYVIASTLDTNFGLDINDSNFQNGSNVQLSNNISDSRAIFNIHYLGDGYYKIIHKKSGKAVDAGDGGSKNGANIQLYDDNGSDYQKWIIKPSWNSNSFEIISKKSGLNVDITERNISNGTNIELYEKTTSGAQQFRFISLDNDAKRTIADGDYHIVSALDDNMVLDVPYNTSEDNTQVQIFTKKTDQNDNQVFKVKYLNNGYYSITTKTTNKMIDDTGNGAFNGNKVSIITPNGSESQQWIIRASAINGFFEIVSKRKNQVLDVTGAKASPETKVQLYARNNTKSQAWKFVPVKKD
ncbi:RICIN domain-containing protein [Streptococcus downei]|uniref:N-acetylmuramoyl-L-alanine amidase sle1 n=1 Tax=Streptococcus downei MFe28 TaxID=764290 RepID=A0A380JF82_STRDO|nr:RICIN domain-containing protein [Streptococcus downei]EFQ56642.1 ricin-type beta-trefoil lectin domain protein [Streptococcus downei F0415]SUN36057.1 N-acetylmuramoyl-L-alanine amidase sle1 [Streptococcus downei MFe28]